MLAAMPSGAGQPTPVPARPQYPFGTPWGRDHMAAAGVDRIRGGEVGRGRLGYHGRFACGRALAATGGDPGESRPLPRWLARWRVPNLGRPIADDASVSAIDDRRVPLGSRSLGLRFAQRRLRCRLSPFRSFLSFLMFFHSMHAAPKIDNALIAAATVIVFIKA